MFSLFALPAMHTTSSGVFKVGYCRGRKKRGTIGCPLFFNFAQLILRTGMVVILTVGIALAYHGLSLGLLLGLSLGLVRHPSPGPCSGLNRLL
jgi:hypothetical protein